MKRAPTELRQRTCYYCEKAFEVKPCKLGRYCSRACHSESMRIRPKADPRPCVVCGTVFKPSRKYGHARYCSKPCIWKGTNGPQQSADIGRQSRHKIRAAQLNRGDGRTYRKYYGRHEHRVVAEQKLGRPLLKGEVVHHIDGNKRNNDPNNLEIITQAEHMRRHGLAVPGVPRRKGRNDYIQTSH